MTHLTQQQMTAILDRAREMDPSLRLYAMIVIGWRHGLRATEVCSLRVGDFDLKGGYLTVQRLKGSMRTTQKLFPDEMAVVVSFAIGKGPRDFLFPGRYPNTHIRRQTFYDNFRDVCKSLDIPRHLSHPHVLKHACGMTVIKQGIENCRQYLGHKSIASTGAYLRVSDDAASKAAMEAFGVN